MNVPGAKLVECNIRQWQQVRLQRFEMVEFFLHGLL